MALKKDSKNVKSQHEDAPLLELKNLENKKIIKIYYVEIILKEDCSIQLLLDLRNS